MLSSPHAARASSRPFLPGRLMSIITRLMVWLVRAWCISSPLLASEHDVAFGFEDALEGVAGDQLVFDDQNMWCLHYIPDSYQLIIEILTLFGVIRPVLKIYYVILGRNPGRIIANLVTMSASIPVPYMGSQQV